MHVASRTYNLLDGKVGGGAIGVETVTVGVYIVGKT